MPRLTKAQRQKIFDETASTFVQEYYKNNPFDKEKLIKSTKEYLKYIQKYENKIHILRRGPLPVKGNIQDYDVVYVDSIKKLCEIYDKLPLSGNSVVHNRKFFSIAWEGPKYAFFRNQKDKDNFYILNKDAMNVKDVFRFSSVEDFLDSYRRLDHFGKPHKIFGNEYSTALNFLSKLYLEYAKKCNISFVKTIAKQIENYTYIAAHTSVVYVGIGTVILLAPPTIFHTIPNDANDDILLHNERGPALGWKDFKAYAFRNRNVPKFWIEPTSKLKLTAKKALGYGDVELRGIACQLVGWDKILEEIGAVVVDENINSQIGLLLVGIIDEEAAKFLKVRCGTGRTFVLPVPNHIMTAKEANAWTYGFDNQLNFIVPEVRT